MSTHDEELALVRESARKWVSSVDTRVPMPQVDYTRRWREMVELGWPGIAVEERYGGADLGIAGAATILTELGRERIGSPMLSTALMAVCAIDSAGTEEQKQRWLPSIVNGDSVFAVAIDEAAQHAPNRIATTATRTLAGWRISGAKRFVPDGVAADHFIVAARMASESSRELGLFVVPAVRVTRQPLAMVDRSDCARVTLTDVELATDARLGDADSSTAVNVIFDVARIGVSAEMQGLAERALDITLEFLRTREQFGQPIGAFQALQHRAAEAYVQLELANACLEAAIHAAREQAGDLSALASLAKATAGEALHRISNEMIQMHGGIGMTDEHVAGRVLKRARVLEALYGNADFHAQRYATLCEF